MGEDKRPLLLRREIEGLIAEGRMIFILDQAVIKADPWITYHPGGEKAIQHMVGRDATDEVTALHSLETKHRMNHYCIGRIRGRWKNFLPPIQGGKYRTLTDESQDEFEIDTNTTSTISSDGSSCDGTSIFDSTDFQLRNRGTTCDLSSSDSISSSVDAIEENDGMAHLNAVTREKIDLDVQAYPSLDYTTQDAIVAKYRLLHDRIKAEGLYQCNYGAYASETCRYILLFAGMLIFLRWRWYVLSGICMGAFWHQLSFTAHDAGHMGITHDFHTDTVIGMLVANFMGGMSIGWWKRNHNVHHIVTNSPEHDPDVEYLPHFATSHRFLESLRSTYYERTMEYDAVAKFCVSFQKYMYYPLMAFGRFNLYRLSWTYLLSDKAPRKGPAWWHRHLELFGQVIFWFWYGYGIIYKLTPSNWGRFTFFMISHMVVAPLHVQLTLSHFAMSTADLGPHESFPQKMLRTTMDVDCPQWLDFFHGGLQFQAIHHLYPRIPRHNLRRTQKLVQEFCNEVGIPYALYGFVDSNKQVIGRLAEVTRQAAILAKCQDSIINNKDSVFAHMH